MKYTGFAYRLPGFLRAHVLCFESDIDRAVRGFAAAVPDDARVLDAGAGEVQYKHYFARHRYCGVDLAVGDSTWNYSRLDAIADLTALPFRSGAFDGAIHIGESRLGIVIGRSAEPTARVAFKRYWIELDGFGEIGDRSVLVVF